MIKVDNVGMILYALQGDELTRITLYGWHRIRLSESSHRRVIRVLGLRQQKVGVGCDWFISAQVDRRYISASGWCNRGYRND